jgi:hypothetical protein
MPERDDGLLADAYDATIIPSWPHPDGGSGAFFVRRKVKREDPIPISRFLPTI